MAKKRETCPRSTLKDLLCRAEGCCESCGENVRGIGEIHHKNRKPNDNDLSNLRLLCPTCHTRAHKNDEPVGPKLVTAYDGLGRKVRVPKSQTYATTDIYGKEIRMLR